MIRSSLGPVLPIKAPNPIKTEATQYDANMNILIFKVIVVP
jgi:hypothetical protein